jgi:hypothetical protein
MVFDERFSVGERKVYLTMKNKIKQTSRGALILLLGGASLACAHMDGETARERLTLSGFCNSAVMMKDWAGKKNWTESEFCDSTVVELEEGPAAVPGINFFDQSQGLDVNRHDLLTEASEYSAKAYEDYKRHTEGNYVPAANEVPFYYGGKLEGTVSYKDGKLIIAFRGTKEGWDWATNLDGALKKGTSVYGFIGGVHEGFHDRYQKNSDAIKAAITKLAGLYEIDPMACDFLITGHSLGGALANLAAADLKNSLKPKGKFKLVTFNAPRVFNEQAAAGAEEMLEGGAIRVVRDFDIVSKVGPEILLGYKHVGKEVRLEQRISENPIESHFHKHTVRDFGSSKPLFSERDSNQPNKPKVGVLEQIALTSSGVANAAYNKVSKAVNRVGSAVSGAANYAYDGVSGAVNRVGETASEVADFVYNWFSGSASSANNAAGAGAAASAGAASTVEVVSDVASATVSKETPTKSAFWSYLGY